MTALEIILERVGEGAQLVVVGKVDRDPNGKVLCELIEHMELVSPQGLSFGLPRTMFADLHPYLMEVTRTERNIVYSAMA